MKLFESRKAGRVFHFPSQDDHDFLSPKHRLKKECANDF